VRDTLRELDELVRARWHRRVELTAETELVADLALDSIEQLDLIVEIENHFEVQLELNEDEEIRTVGELVGWIERARCEAAR
jgi:acyl carrier protein